MLIVLIDGDSHATLRDVTGRPRSLRKIILRRELLAAAPSVVKDRRLIISNAYLMVVMVLVIGVVHQHATFNLKLLVVVIVRIGVL